MSVSNFFSSNPVIKYLSNSANHLNNRLKNIPEWKKFATIVFATYAFMRLVDKHQKYTNNELKDRVIKQLSQMPIIRTIVAKKLNIEKRENRQSSKRGKETISTFVIGIA